MVINKELPVEVRKFSTTVAREVVTPAFRYVLECVLGDKTPPYSLGIGGETFEASFYKGLEQRGLKPTEYKIGVCITEFNKLTFKAEKLIRNKLMSK